LKSNIDIGKDEYFWAKGRMPILSKIAKNSSNKAVLTGFKIGMCLHITKETSVLVIALSEAGAKISLCAANPLSTKDSVRDFLESANIRVFSNESNDIDSFYSNMDKVLDTRPQIITDDGAELHKKASLRNISSMGGTEETTSGVNRLKVLSKEGQLPYPIIAVNESIPKQLLDNRFGTGQSTIEAIIRVTGVILASKKIVVCGYGWVGKGVAKCAKAMGAKVTITEVDPIRAIEAFFDGYEVEELEKVLPENDIFITCTGQINVIGRNHFDKLKDGAILCNAGHFDVEIDVKYLKSLDSNHYDPKLNVTCYHVGNLRNKKSIFVLSHGRVINLVGAEGNSPEVMDISFSNQFLAIIYLSKVAHRLLHRVYKPPKKLDTKIAHLALTTYGLKIDRLNPEQISYFKQ
jgi:adenosylhomocysteinase